MRRWSLFIGGMLLVGGLAACGEPGAATPTVTEGASAPTSTDLPDPTATLTAEPTSGEIIDTEDRYVQVISVSGQVEVSTSINAPLRPASAGDVLRPVSTVSTGADGTALLAVDDETQIVVAPNTVFEISALEGTVSSPISRFFLNLGQVFNLRASPLPGGGSYEVVTPAGTAAIRGSSMGVSYDPDTLLAAVTCLEGQCAAQVGDTDQPLAGGETVGMSEDAGLGDVQPMTPTQLLEWDRALLTVQDSGASPDDSTACACDDTTWVCDDGTRIEDFPTCRRQACTCDGTTLVCDDGTATADDPVCGGTGGGIWLAPGCACVGADMVCDDGTVVEDIPYCGGDFSSYLPPGCSCDGTTLVCDTGSLPEFPLCGGSGGIVQPGTGLPGACTCEGVDYYCAGVLVQADSFVCGGSGGSGSLPDTTCTCQGTTTVCSDGTVIPDDPACGG